MTNTRFLKQSTNGRSSSSFLRCACYRYLCRQCVDWNEILLMHLHCLIPKSMDAFSTFFHVGVAPRIIQFSSPFCHHCCTGKAESHFRWHQLFPPFCVLQGGQARLSASMMRPRHLNKVRMSPRLACQCRGDTIFVLLFITLRVKHTLACLQCQRYR